MLTKKILIIFCLCLYSFSIYAPHEATLDTLKSKSITEVTLDLIKEQFKNITELIEKIKTKQNEFITTQNSVLIKIRLMNTMAKQIEPNVQQLKNQNLELINKKSFIDSEYQIQQIKLERLTEERNGLAEKVIASTKNLQRLNQDHVDILYSIEDTQVKIAELRQNIFNHQKKIDDHQKAVALIKNNNDPFKRTNPWAKNPNL